MKQNFNLEDIPKANLYRVPDDYFQKLPQVVMNRVAGPQQTPANSWWSGISYAYRTSVASFLILVSFVAAFYFSPGLNQENSSARLSGINQQEALEYFLTQDNINSSELADLNLADTDVSADFIHVTSGDILETVDDQQLEEIY
ncbi:hypothetical protein HUW51_13010 [Adhaeribacter swui]|uniref:Uncharacterized protein n=1 Tax=Adhaeribacter swui TaxID=2086471 RepID=A0A7G7G8W1_9BACT|nr:hypothetical protein [Adhaeribacter swui]QNF33595.1 hypothetical protein HUW51_13010 [Adhaeribacter swui]